MVSLKGSANRGLSVELQSAFPDVIPMIRPVVDNTQICPDWMRGFASAEGCFAVGFPKSPNSKLEKVQLIFQLTQHSRDEKLMRCLTDFFNCGNIYKDGEVFVFRVSRVADIDNKIIPFFKEYPILGGGGI